MRTTLYAIVVGASLLLAGSWRAGAQDALFTSERDCTADVWSLCARVMPGSGRVLGCLHAHVSELSVGCSTILSKASWTAQECANDIRQFCPHVTFGNISNCLDPHLDVASASCKSALAFMASPAAGRN
jgi:hypothetical protein